MQWSDISFQPSRKTLREFAGLWIVFFGALAAWQFWGKDRAWLAMALAGLAVTIGPVGLLYPHAIRLIYVGWMVAVFPIGWTISRLVMAVIYYGIFTPVALLFRVIGRDALHLRRQPDAATYWLPKPQAAGVAQYFRQF